MEINKLSDFLTQMPKNLNGINAKVRYFYIELGRRSFYDRQYEYMMFEEESTFSIYTNKIFTNPNIIICTTLTKQFKELLDSLGIESKIETDKTGHTFLSYKDENGVEHSTDLTRDLKNVQFNCSTSHFAQKTISVENLRKIDLKLNYITNSKGYSNDYWYILRDRLESSNYSIQTKFEIILKGLQEFGDLSKLGETEIIAMYQKFIKYCGNDKFKMTFYSQKIAGKPEEHRVDLVIDKRCITYLLNKQTYLFEKEKERNIEQRSL